LFDDAADVGGRVELHLGVVDVELLQGQLRRGDGLEIV